MLLLVGAVALTLFVRQAREGLRQSRQRACVANLRDLEGAKEQYALEHEGRAPEGMAALRLGYLRAMPVCPAGGTYSPGDMQQPVSCDYPGHDASW